jgi:Domain of unknown function (DUF4383)
MNAPLIARILGLLFLIAAIAGFVPWFAPAAPLDAQVVTLDAAYRMLFWVFPVNAVHDLVHLIFGIWGVLASFRFNASVVYLRCVAWIYLILVIFGMIPIMNTLFGIAPIYGWDVALHALVALIAAYGGYGRGSIKPVVQAPSE